MAKDVISFRCGTQMAKILHSVADKRGISRGEMLRQVVKENVSDYKELSEVERNYAEALEQERQDEMRSKITERKMKAATFLNYVRSQVSRLRSNGATEKEVVGILESMKPIAERRDKLNELDAYIEDFEDGSTQENEVPTGGAVYEH